jgi:hypothetical protein
VGEKSRVNTALAILGVTGALVVYSAFDQSFKVPEGVWGAATAAAAYYFTTAKREDDD